MLLFVKERPYCLPELHDVIVREGASVLSRDSYITGGVVADGGSWQLDMQKIR